MPDDAVQTAMNRSPLSTLDPPPETTARDVMLTLGGPVILAIAAVFLRTPSENFRFGNVRLLTLLGYEIVLGALIFWRLWKRGWHPRHVGKRWQGKDVLRGLGVWILGYLAYVAGWLALVALQPGIAARLATGGPTGHPSVVLVVLASVINPVFEELLWLGFAVNGPGRRRPLAGFCYSVIPRCLVHLYQGWLALFSIAPLGIWYWRYYTRSGRLGPVIVAHGVQDAVGLGALLVRGAA